MMRIITISITAVLFSLLLVNGASAANKDDFNPSRIIDDYVFYKSDSMSAQQIQNFLESKVPNCDYNGTQQATDWGYPSITHAQLAEYKRNGTNGFKQDSGFHAPPYKCIRSYVQNTPQMEAASGLCQSIPAGSNKSAAQIIKDISIACGINPQALIVLLEKEQSLVTDTWPLNRQLNSATGFACSDTAPCDTSYSGFFYQVYYAARQFKIYQAYPDRYNYRAGRTQKILWNPDETCGSSQVFIENQATAGLYIYTPYRPNAAALNDLYGTGDKCSALGNRNFWRIFTDWFGSTYTGQNRQELFSKGTNTLSRNSQLKSGEFLTSPNGRYILVMHPSGQLLMYKSKQLVWRSGDINWAQRGSYLSFQSDGNVVLYRDTTPLWSTRSNGTTATKLILQNDGNLVLYSDTNKVLWASDTMDNHTPLVYKGSKLKTGESLRPNEYLRSSDWRYFLIMQNDGNLVLYTAGRTQPIWNSASVGKGGNRVSLQADGNLVVYNDSDAIWASDTNGRSDYAGLSLQSDGNLVLYNTTGKAIWASDTDQKGGEFVSFQSDGNLVIYGNQKPLWATGTNHKGGNLSVMQSDGNWVIYGSSGAIWATGTNRSAQPSVAYECNFNSSLNIESRLNKKDSVCSPNKLFKLSFQSDGNLVLYTRETSPIWTSKTNGVFFRSDLNL